MKNIKYIIKNAVAFCLVISILTYTTACRKSSPISNEENTSLVIDNGEKLPWWAIVVAVVIISINVTEGQYHQTITTDPNGSTTTTIDCIGLGHCHISSNIKSIGNDSPFSSLEALSSTQLDDGYDFKGDAQLIKTKNGKVLLRISNSKGNKETYERFFYDNEISVSMPYIIDNPSVLRHLNEEANVPIVIQGDYRVYDGDGYKFIILK